LWFVIATVVVLPLDDTSHQNSHKTKDFLTRMIDFEIFQNRATILSRVFSIEGIKVASRSSGWRKI
jgi:hypothetical protein